MQTNRQARRALRAQAAKTAATLAASAFDYSDGQMVRVTHPRAVATLARVFQQMLQRGGCPYATEISEGEAAAFPRWSDGNRGMVHVLAVGLDTAGAASFAMRSVAARDVRTGILRRVVSAGAAEQAARAALTQITAYPGFPAIHEKGGRA